MVCGREREDTTVWQCQRCRDKGKDRRMKMKAAHVCRYCHSPIVGRSDRAACAACAGQSTAKTRAYRQQHLDNGACARCGKPPLVRGKEPLCEGCWFGRVAKDRAGGWRNRWFLRDLLRAQGYQCAYTGRPLIPGINATVDHIVPTSRGGSNDIANLQWVDRTVNLMKTNMTHEEFLETMRTIIGRFDNDCTLNKEDNNA